MSEFTYKDDDHSYTLDQVSLPSVTTVMREEGLIKQWNVDEWFLLRGTYGHKMAELYLKGTLDEQTLDPELLPRLRALKSFVEATGFIVEGMEVPMYHPNYRYAFRADMWGYFADETVLSIIDIKISDSINKSVKYQLAAYKEGLRANGIICPKAYVLLLKSNGSPWLSPAFGASILRSAQQVFLSALCINTEKKNEELI